MGDRLILRLFPVARDAGHGCWRRFVAAPTPWSARALRACRAAGRPSTRQFVSREELKLLLQMEPERGRRHGHRGRDDRQDLRPRRDHGARGHGAAGGRGRAARHRHARATRSASSRSAASPASRSSPTACSTSWAWSPPWISCSRGAQAPDVRALMRPAELRARRPSASTTCCARCRRTACSSRWWWTSTAARSASSRSRTSSSRSWARSRTSTTAPPTPVERLPDGSYRVAGRAQHRRAQRGAGLGPAQGRLRDGGRPRAGHRCTASRWSARCSGSRRYTITVLEADSAASAVAGRATRPRCRTALTAPADVHEPQTYATRRALRRPNRRTH